MGVSGQRSQPARGLALALSLLMRLPPRGLGSRSTELPLKNAHRCFIGKPRKPCCGREIKAALVVLTGRHGQQQIACLPVGANRQAGAETQCRRLSFVGSYASECQVCGLRRTRRVRQRLAFASYLLQLVKRASHWIEQKRTRTHQCPLHKLRERTPNPSFP